jgi:lipopolysaccharide export system ATP-binding protein
MVSLCLPPVGSQFQCHHLANNPLLYSYRCRDLLRSAVEVPTLPMSSPKKPLPKAKPIAKKATKHDFSSHALPTQEAEQRIWDNNRESVSYDDRGADNTLLYTRGLVKVYDGRAVVNGVDIEVKRGEIVGLLGPNGAGKTTTFYMIVGLVRPNGGQVVFDGKDATFEPMYKRARLGMGYLPQEESIFRKLTVRENILAVMETQNYTKQERQDQTQALLEKFGIAHVADNLAITLSGGEKRRLTIARSLVTEPKLLMLDEPFSGVDPIAVSEIQEIIRMLRRAGLAILITDHNVRETLSIVDRAYLIYEGKVKLEGTQEFLVNDATAKTLYLGEDFKM